MRRDIGRPAKRVDHDVFQQHRHQHHEGRTRQRSEDRPKTTDDDHEQQQEGLLDTKGLSHLNRAKIDRKDHGPGHTDIERADTERRNLCHQRVHPDDFSRNIHIANGHPLPSHRPTSQVARQPAKNNKKGQAEQISGRRRGVRTGNRIAKHRTLWRSNHAGCRIVIEPRHLVEHPDQKELRSQRYNSKIESLDPQAGQTKHDPDNRRGHAASQNAERQV